ncbi:unnamed protein product, partial [Bubo scandiacus]
EIPFKQKKNPVFNCKLGKILEQAAQGGCGVSILRNSQSPTRYRPVQSALSSPALSRELH